MILQLVSRSFFDAVGRCGTDSFFLAATIADDLGQGIAAAINKSNQERSMMTGFMARTFGDMDGMTSGAFV